MSVTRRSFLTGASAIALGTRLAASRVQGANDRIRIGVMGTGGRARGLINLLQKLPGTELVAVCDVYEPRLLEAAAIAGTAAAKMTDYRGMLDDRAWRSDVRSLATPEPDGLTDRASSSPFTHSIGAPLDRRGGLLFSRSEARLPAESRQLGLRESRRTSSSRQTAPG